MATQSETRAVVRCRATHVLVLCPMGHLIEAQDFDDGFARSAFEAEVGLLQAGRPNRFDKLAATCQGFGHE